MSESLDPKSFEETKTYRIHAQYRQWIGKPDPSGFGKFYVYSDDPSWTQEKAIDLTRKGHKVLSIQKANNGKWKVI